MPSGSRAQQQAAAIAKHDPDKLYKRNRGLLKMSAEDLEDYARTPHKGLPERASKVVPLAEMMRARKRKRN